MPQPIAKCLPALLCLALAAGRAAAAEIVVLAQTQKYEDDLGKMARTHHLNNFTGERQLWQVTGQDDFATRLRKVIMNGDRIKRLEVFTHGQPGEADHIMKLRDFTISHGPFEGLSDAFAPGAEIWLHSCLTGKGEEGMLYLRAIGRAFLTKGGSVEGPVWYYFAVSPGGENFMLPAVLKPLLGVSPMGVLRYRMLPDGRTGRYAYLYPGQEEFHEFSTLTKEQFRFIYPGS